MKKPTLTKVRKAIIAYAQKHNRKYINVIERYTSAYNDPSEGKTAFEAYIDGFGIWPSAETIEGLIEQFDKRIELIDSPVEPIDIDNLELPF